MRLSEIWVYPVKSLRGYSVPSTTLIEGGLALDRRWMIVSEEGQFLTQRDLPQMVSLFAKFGVEDTLIISHRSGGRVEIDPLTDQSSLIYVQVWKDKCPAIPAPVAVNRQLSVWLGREVQLVTLISGQLRAVNPQYGHITDQVSFADGFPLLVTSVASINALNHTMKYPIEMERMRANLIISDCEPYAEDSWQSVEINGIAIDLVKPCSRCIIPSINLQSGVSEPHVIRALNESRRIGGSIFFGYNAIHRQLGQLHVGAEVNVLAKR